LGVFYRASRNRHRHRAWGASPPSVRFGSTIVTCPPALGASSSLDYRGVLPLMPPDRRSWSLKDAEPPTPRVAAIARDDRASRDCQSHPHLLWPPPPLSRPTAPRATAVATGPGVRRHRSFASGASSPLALPPRERRRHSVLGECRRQGHRIREAGH
jgi:hypothetical protein